jgi:hypothetical protein
VGVMRTNKQMITRTTDNRGVRVGCARDISVSSPSFFSQTLSLRKKTRESGESGERERDFFEKKRTSCIQQQTTQREENSLRETLEEAPRTESKKSTRSVPSTLFSRSSRRREQKTHGGHIGETRGSFFVFV